MPRETMYIDRCGRRHQIDEQGLFAPLLIDRMAALAFLHPRNLWINPVPYGGDALRTGKRPARAGRRCLAHCSFRAAATSTRYAPIHPARAGRRMTELFELFRHAEVFFQMGKRLTRPILQLGIVAGLGICLEQRDRIPVCLHLNLIVALVEVLAVLCLQVIQHFLMLGIERRGSLAFTLPPSTSAFNSLEVFW